MGVLIKEKGSRVFLPSVVPAVNKWMDGADKNGETFPSFMLILPSDTITIAVG